MNAPVGGEPRGIAAVAAGPLKEVNSLEATSCDTTVNGAGAGSFAVTTTAGSGLRAVQQLALTIPWLCDRPAQQLCALFFTGCRQAPSGASIAPVNRVATAARLNAPRNMVTAYHGKWFLP